MAAPRAAATSPLRRVVELDEAVPRRLLKALEISGDGRIWIPIPIALLLASPSPELYCVAMGLLAGFLLDLSSSAFSSTRPPIRPLYNKGMYLTFAVDHWSFPSGHSSRVFFISTFLYLVRGSLREAAAGVVISFCRRVFLWSVVTSASRILLGNTRRRRDRRGCLGLLEAASFPLLAASDSFHQFLLDR
ncbi:unnamed protein product [Spirodela intermedia]|uniref:Phosphatidic acid phosphatase type 2/haloperoxidase domain-containing protein n=1 Tax=Spirodela intermedia TaxID=51605 RepID=A0A7I8J358_SPIIN|nr:unnamed protein product [Spirodela intermedia]CAA6664548.1 unnamed protein product [Spirodela intermedia]